ncbi:hypothetical protein IW261DRAFT_1574655 [Armillaria novae-zelandiae]|uniref:Uncharacterized protein n=1 Tax=Armillaria novae-zelandiae TaxID=153914 RepID=A0AA39NHN1_9AGAR|nr:hypothetical protein IW261DRAFT_1574655 [Armillaria novae-zelandiae]
MSTAAEIPQLTGSERALVFDVLDTLLNSTILVAFMHGMYTCVLAGTFWIISVGQRPTGAGRHMMIALITAIYLLTTISFSTVWFTQRNATITHGENFWTAFLAYASGDGVAPMMSLVRGIPAGMATLLADSAMIWRCWVVWGRRWIIVLIPILCIITEGVFKLLDLYYSVRSRVDNLDDISPEGDRLNWTLIYVSCTLATTLLCTLLIVYRILTVGGTKHGGAGVQAYRGVVEVIIESASLYTVSLIIDMILTARKSSGGSYSDAIAGTMRGVAPTLIVARVASGHARPDDSWNGSVMSSLDFGSRAHPPVLSQMSSEGNLTRSVILAEENDLETGRSGPGDLPSESRV